MLMLLALIVWGLYLTRRLRGGVSTARLLAENQLLQMYLLAERLRARHRGKAAGDIAKLNEDAERLIRAQFELRPLLRAQADDHSQLLALGARLCQELNSLQLIRGENDVARRIRADRVSREQVERELHGPVLRRLRTQTA
jgi:hypothetical protein